MSLFAKDLISFDTWERAYPGVGNWLSRSAGSSFFLSRKFARLWILFARTQTNAVWLFDVWNKVIHWKMMDNLRGAVLFIYVSSLLVSSRVFTSTAFSPSLCIHYIRSEFGWKHSWLLRCDKASLRARHGRRKEMISKIGIKSGPWKFDWTWLAGTTNRCSSFIRESLTWSCSVLRVNQKAV